MSRLIVLALALLLAPQAVAQVTVYRCVDAQGHVQIGDAPCPRGQQEEVRRVPALAPVPPSPKPAATPLFTPPTVVTTPAPVLVAQPAPAPAQPRLYECVAPNGERYASTTPEGTARWVSMWSLDIPVATGPSTSLAITGGDVRIGPSGISMTAPLPRAWWPDNAVVLVRDPCQ